MKSMIMQPSLAQKTHLGEKTQSRRPLKPQPNEAHTIDHIAGIWKPKYKKGEVIYVKETFAYIWPSDVPMPKEECKIEYKGETGNKYPGDWPEDEAKGNPDAPKWTPSIHMPQWAARTHLSIRDVRIEHIQDISEEDCLKEGLNEKGTKRWVELGWDSNDAHGREFSLLWDSIYGKTKYNWVANPLVWVYEFEKVELYA